MTKDESGGIKEKYGHVGCLPAKDETPYSRIDLYDENGNLIQQRWYNFEGKAILNKDLKHGNKGGIHVFPHYHAWINGKRQKEGYEKIVLQKLGDKKWKVELKKKI